MKKTINNILFSQFISIIYYAAKTTVQKNQNFNLVIVPVDGEFDYTEFSLKTYLNKVYAPAITSWEVKKVEKLVVDYNEGEKNGLNTSRSFLSSFNKK